MDTPLCALHPTGVSAILGAPTLEHARLTA